MLELDAVHTTIAPVPAISSDVAGLAARGFAPLTVALSKGHAFEIWLRPAVPGRMSRKTAVVSRGGVDYATSYVSEGVLRGSVPVSDPRGHLLFRCDTERGVPRADKGFQCKFGAL